MHTLVASTCLGLGARVGGARVTPLLNAEATDGQDLVLWYCAHLHHEAADGGAEVHSSGSDLIPFRY